MTARGSRIEGRAHLADDSPVVEARVFFIEAPVPVPDIATLTDEQGRFSLQAPASGRYELVCNADGHDPATVAIDVDEGSEIVEVDIELG
jgi:hypothetical protein